MGKQTGTKGLDIKFNIGKKTYRLRSSSYDFILEEVRSKKDKDENLVECYDHVGSASTMHGIFQYLYKEHHLRTSILTEVVDLVEELSKLLTSLQETTHAITVECFLSQEDKKSYVKRLDEAENRIEQLQKDKLSLTRKKK